jgi:hypothetical protein
MPIDDEFRHHLHELMVETSLKLRGEEEAYKRRLIWEAQQKHNGAAVMTAHRDAKIHAFRARAEATITKYFDALENCSIEVDDAVEKEMLKHIGSLTSAGGHLQFPPTINGAQAIAVQSSYAREQARVGNQIYKSAANRLREMKLKGRLSVSVPGPGSNSLLENSHNTKSTLEKVEEHPTAFVSYSWESADHRKWVLQFATELKENGISVILDQWDLPHGGDKAIFMERTAGCDFVLVVCTPEYAEKANKRHGGVGYEAMIITGQIANSIDSNKFIPVLRLGDWDSALPVWLKTKRGVDLRGAPHAQSEFQDLLRTLHREPVPSPPLGDRPSFDTKVSDSLGVSPALSASVSDLSDSDFSVKEWELLANAVKDPGGQIIHIKAIGGDGLAANGRNFIERGNPRSLAEWRSALMSLEGKGLVEGVGYNKDYFRVTGEGYALADQLGEFRRWDSKQITLEAHYIKGQADTVTLPCKGVIEIPEKYYPDQVGADGSVMRSIKERRSLLVNGVDSKTLDALGWSPTDALFEDAATGKTERFQVERADSEETGAIRLEITG